MIFDKVNNKDKEAMTDIKKNLKTIKSRIEKIAVKFNRDPSEIKLIVVTKKFDFEKIKPLIDAGHLFFGENKVQEAEKKWTKTLSNNKDIELHMVGPIQSNKIKTAINLFTVIHSIENIIASSANTVERNYRTIVRHSTTPHNVILFGKDGEGRVH